MEVGLELRKSVNRGFRKSCQVELFIEPAVVGAVEKDVSNTSIRNENSPTVIFKVNGLKGMRNIPSDPIPIMINVVNIGEPPVRLEELVVTRDGTVMSRIPLSDTLVGVGVEHARMQKIIGKGKEEALKKHRGELTELEKNASKGRKNKKAYLNFREIITQIIPGDSLVFNVSLFYKSQGRDYVENATYTIEMLEPLPLPSVPEGAEHSDWYAGDVHVHSTHTDCDGLFNGVLSISQIKTSAQAMQMNWTVITDHNYCLDSAEYEQIKQETTSASDSIYASLFGEEVSVRELKKGGLGCGYLDQDTAHLGGVGVDTFVPSVVDISKQASSPNTQNGINQLKSNGGLAIINHPSNTAWDFSDESYECATGENGIELINKYWDSAEVSTVNDWIYRRLLKGFKSYAFGGSDTENIDDIGVTYTVVYANSPTRSDIENALRSGKTYATAWQGLSIWTKPSSGSTWTWMGDTLQLSEENYVDIYVSYNTGSGRSMTIFVKKGIVGQAAEELPVVDLRIVSGSGSYTLTDVQIDTGKTTYFRAWGVDTVNDTWRAYTSPIWISVVADTTPPSTPTLISPSGPIGTTTPTFNWNPATDDLSGIDYYRIQVDDDISFGSPEIDTTTTSTYYTPPSGVLSNEVTYYWRVRAVDNAGNFGGFTDRWSFTIDIKPDLTLQSSDISFSDSSPSDGDDVLISAIISNTGGQSASNVKVRFSHDGTQIGSDYNIYSISAGGSASAWVWWNNVPQGSHTVEVTVDPGNAIAEADEGNNISQYLNVDEVMEW